MTCLHRMQAADGMADGMADGVAAAPQLQLLRPVTEDLADLERKISGWRVGLLFGALAALTLPMLVLADTSTEVEVTGTAPLAHPVRPSTLQEPRMSQTIKYQDQGTKETGAGHSCMSCSATVIAALAGYLDSCHLQSDLCSWQDDLRCTFARAHMCSALATPCVCAHLAGGRARAQGG